MLSGKTIITTDKSLEAIKNIAYNKAIDDFICNIEKDARYQHPIEVIEVDRYRYIAEQLKAGGTE